MIEFRNFSVDPNLALRAHEQLESLLAMAPGGATGSIVMHRMDSGRYSALVRISSIVGPYAACRFGGEPRFALSDAVDAVRVELEHWASLHSDPAWRPIEPTTDPSHYDYGVGGSHGM